ncbi:MAG: hypothetical protein J7L91_05305 [Candidatus Korarchaeota archaeon]|nr:hypothetical protein [Candidatus Korarchaeota archaeon]
MDKVRDLLSMLPRERESESMNFLLEQLRRNLETWHNMSSITDEQYERGLKKLEEIRILPEQ